MDTYKTIATPCEGVFTEKRSKFIAMAFPVTTLEEIKEHLAECQKRYFDARHVCYAYMLGHERAIFRANIDHLHKNHVYRLRFVERYFGHPLCDIGVSNHAPVVKEEWIRERISEFDHLTYKFIMCLEGNDVATNLKWVMSSNSLAVMPPPVYETWYMEGRLIPNYHYVAIKPDYSDLEERLQYYIDHPDEAEAIIRHAHEWQEQFFDRQREKLISLMVLHRYFERTGQK